MYQHVEPDGPVPIFQAGTNGHREVKDLLDAARPGSVFERTSVLVDARNERDRVIAGPVPLCVEQHDVAARPALDLYGKSDPTEWVGLHRHVAHLGRELPVDQQDRVAAHRESF